MLTVQDVINYKLQFKTKYAKQFLHLALQTKWVYLVSDIITLWHN